MAFNKIKIEGTIRVVTGLHIGGDSSFSAIGAIDSPVVRDPVTHDPIIPGSTLKGKMRSLLARYKDTERFAKTKGFEADCWEVTRLFGSSKKKSDAAGEGMQMSRLQFSDCFLANKEDLPQVFENKFENTIDRLTSEANPRQIERVVRGAVFDMEIIYNVEDPDDLEEDFKYIRLGFSLIENDYLGGGGSRGNGRVRFEDRKATLLWEDADLKVPSVE